VPPLGSGASGRLEGNLLGTDEDAEVGSGVFCHLCPGDRACLGGAQNLLSPEGHSPYLLSWAQMIFQVFPITY
jgi:hypothetical protein